MTEGNNPVETAEKRKESPKISARAILEQYQNLLPHSEAAIIQRISQEFTDAGMENEVIFSSKGVYSCLIRFKKGSLADGKKIRVFRTIFSQEENVVGDVLSQVAYALRRGGDGDIYTGKAEAIIDNNPELIKLVHKLTENPTMASLTELCELKKKNTTSVTSQKRLERQLELVEEGVGGGESIVDLIGYLVTQHPFSVSEDGLACGVSVSFGGKKPLRPAVTGAVINGVKITGITMIVDVEPERFDLADIWQGSLKERIFQDEISGVLISRSNSSEEQDNSLSLSDMIPGNIMTIAEREQVFEQINKKRRKKASGNIANDLQQIYTNRKKRGSFQNDV